MSFCCQHHVRMQLRAVPSPTSKMFMQTVGGCTGGYAGNRGYGTELWGSGTVLQSLFKQVFHSAFDVDVGGLCKGSVAGVVCFVEACELQCVASVSACGQCVFHFSKDCNAKLGIIIQICYICELLAHCAFVPDFVRIKK